MPRHILARLTLAAALAAAPALADPAEASSRGLRNAAVAGAVALGAVGVLAAAANASPYHHGYGYPSHGYGHAPVSYGYGHAPVSYGYDDGYGAAGYVNRYEHSYDLGYGKSAYVPSGYGYAHGYPTGVYYNAPAAPIVTEVPPPVVVQRTVRYRPVYRTHEIYRPLPVHRVRTVRSIERFEARPYYPRRVVRVHKGYRERVTVVRHRHHGYR